MQLVRSAELVAHKCRRQGYIPLRGLLLLGLVAAQVSNPAMEDPYFKSGTLNPEMPSTG